jgi:hypothetical protein
VKKVIALDFDVLQVQASKLDQLGADIGQASSAVTSMNLAGGAFGVLCNFLVVPAQVAATVAGAMIQDCEGLMQRAGTQLRNVVADAEEREQDFSQIFRALERELG